MDADVAIARDLLGDLASPWPYINSSVPGHGGEQALEQGLLELFDRDGLGGRLRPDLREERRELLGSRHAPRRAGPDPGGTGTPAARYSALIPDEDHLLPRGRVDVVLQHGVGDFLDVPGAGRPASRARYGRGLGRAAGGG